MHTKLSEYFNGFPKFDVFDIKKISKPTSHPGIITEICYILKRIITTPGVLRDLIIYVKWLAQSKTTLNQIENTRTSHSIALGN